MTKSNLAPVIGTPCSPRRGVTVVEVTVAFLLLGMLLLAISQTMARVANQRRTIHRRLLAMELLANQMEHAAATPWKDLTVESLEKQWKLPQNVADRLPGAMYQVEIDAATGPLRAKRITVQLTWHNAGGEHVAPLRLTMWRHHPEVSP